MSRHMIRRYIIPIIIGFIPVSCATADYTYYVVHPEKDALEAHDPKNDLPLLKTCTPTDLDQGPCIGMLREDFFKMWDELLLLRQELKDCQKGPKP